MTDHSRQFRAVGLAGLWLFAAVTLLSIAAQNIIFVGFAAWFLWGRFKGKAGFPPVLGWWLLFLAWSLFTAFFAENQPHTLDTWKRWLLAFALGSGLRPLDAAGKGVFLWAGGWAVSSAG